MHLKTQWQLIAVALLSIAISLSYLTLPQSIYSLDDRLRDFLFVLRGPIPQTNEVIIIDIDEAALERFGRWPWPRKEIATLLDRISSAGPLIIGLDMIFPEADNSSPHRLAERLNMDSQSLENYDDILADSMQRNSVVGGYLFLFEATQETRVPKIPYVLKEHGKDDGGFIPEPAGFLLNIEPLHTKLKSMGFLNNISDSDGVIRSVPLVMRYDHQLYLSLSLELMRSASDIKRVDILNTEAGVMGIKMAGFVIPTSRFATMHVNFRGPSRHFNYISAADLMDESFDVTQLHNKIVLLGTSAIGLGDVHATPYTSAMAGVEVHANVIDNILQGDFITLPADDLIYNIFLIIIIVTITVLLFSKLSRLMMIPAFLFLSFGLYLFYSWMLFSNGVILNILFGLLAFIMGVVAALLIDFLYEARQKEEVTHELEETTATMLEQSKSAAMGEMVGMIAHQWRQPLSSMSAISSKVKLKGQLGKLDSVDKDMDEVVDLTRYLSETIEDFRNFFKEDKSFEVTPLELVVERSLRFTSHLLKTKDVVVTKNLKESSAYLNVNEVTQVLVNLIKNSVDAYEERAIKERTLHFETEQNDGEIILHVSDTAGGLEEEKLEKIFEKSFSTKGAEGTGLGLYMCKKIIEENHLGFLHVRNFNGGLTFSIGLPMSQ